MFLSCSPDEEKDDDHDDDDEEEEVDADDMMNCTCWIILGNVYSTHKPPSPCSKENNGEGVKHK